jgi:hypothetical protein
MIFCRRTPVAVDRRNPIRAHINTAIKIPHPQKKGNFLFLEQLSDY